MTAETKRRITVILVWFIRLAIGSTFIISGCAKMIDPYGSIYKIAEYLTVWSIDIPDSMVLMAAVSLSTVEFMIGMALATGSYKRTSPVFALLIMAVMLPLSAYLMIADPVEHCGCFGDFIVLSNRNTFIKNLVITIALLWLTPHNKKVYGPFPWFIQWLQAFTSLAYISVIGLIGYHEQPLIDFRPYKAGTQLIDNSAQPEDDSILFVYERQGTQRTFTADDIPDDSTWTFIRRIEPTSNADAANTFSIADDNGNNVTDEVIATSGEQLLLLIPDMSNPDISQSYTINELNSYIKKHGGSLIAVGAGTRQDKDTWLDLSMADYPVYFGEDTSIKSVARGKLAIVYLRDGEIKWKRTLSSINLDKLSGLSSLDYQLDSLDTNGAEWFRLITGTYLLTEVLICLLGQGMRIIRRRQRQAGTSSSTTTKA